MIVADILFSDAGPFEETVNIPLTACPMWKLVNISQVVSEDRSFEDYSILRMYIAQGQG